MKSLGFVPLLTLLASVGSSYAAKASLSSVQKTSSFPVVANKFIIEVSDASQIPGKRSVAPVRL